MICADSKLPAKEVMFVVLVLHKVFHCKKLLVCNAVVFLCFIQIGRASCRERV
jgi:hypothetical protein